MGTHNDKHSSITFGGFKGSYFDKRGKCEWPTGVAEYSCFELGSPHPCDRCSKLAQRQAP